MKSPRVVTALIILVSVIFMAALLGSNLGRSSDSDIVRQAKEVQTLHELELERGTSTFWAYFWPITICLFIFIACGILTYLVLEARKDRAHRRKLEELKTTAEIATLRPDDNGNYDARLTTYGVVHPNSGNLRQPSIHTYSPHITSRADSQVATLPGPTFNEEAPPPVEPIGAKEALRYLSPNELTWMFGLAHDGKPVIASIRDSVHVMNVGSTGQGKTTQTANMLYQLVAMNEPQLYNLVIADLKGTIAGPFSPWAKYVATEPAQYIELMAAAAAEADRRRRAQIFDAPTFLIVVEEALVLKKYLDPQQLKAYASYLDQVALLGREYGIFLLACSQVDYASQEFQSSRASFLTKMMAATMPSAAGSLGFTNRPLINQLWKEKRKGQFLLEGADGDRLILAPRLDLKGGELTGLLSRVARPAPEPQTKGDARPGYQREDTTQYQATATIEPERELVETKLERALRLWNAGANSHRDLAAAYGCTRYQAGIMINQLVAMGKIKIEDVN